MKKLNIRPLALLLSLFLFAAVLSPMAMAAGPIDTGASCSLSVSFRPEGKAAAGVRFYAWRVADVSTGCAFTPAKNFAGYSIMSILAAPGAENYRQLASTLPGYIADDAIAPDAEAKTDALGTAVFTDLPVGLYLISGDVYAADRQFHTPEAFMICLPNRLEDDSWQYDVVVEEKYISCSDSADVDLSVLKVWSDSAANTHSADRVVVKLYDGNKLYDTQTLSKENDWKHEWKGLYGGTVWTLVETEYPSGYTPKVERRGDLFVVTNSKPVSASASGRLPQTGLLWWPVPLLLVGGALFVVLGVVKRKRA